MSLKSVQQHHHLLDELQAVLAHGSVARRVEALRKVTDLFLSGDVVYSTDQLALFDDVLGCLIDRIEAQARVMLAERLAPIANAPPRLMRTLAFDDLIEVAAPVLAQSDLLDDTMLIENATTKSQQHLIAISTRKTLSFAVTDVLIERGNDAVVTSTVTNRGSQFSEQGYSALVARATRNDDIAMCFASRPSIPRRHYLSLVARASNAVRARLAAVDPRIARDVAIVVDQVAHTARTTPVGIAPDTVIARHLVQSLYNDGRLDEPQLLAFAEAGKFDEINASIATLARVSIDLAETMMIESRDEGIFILAKVAELSWTAVKSIIMMREKLCKQAEINLDAERVVYERLRSSTAQQVLRFQRMQRTAPAL